VQPGELVDHVVELFPADPVWAGERVLTLVLAGRQDLDAVLQPALAREFGFAPFWAAAAASCHPDAGRRDPARALEVLELVAAEDRGIGTWGVSCFARMQLGDVEGARADLERGDQLVRDRNRNWNAWYALLWAWIHHEQGQPEQARAYMTLAEDILDDIFYDGERAWSGSALLSVVHEVRARVRS